MSLEPPKCGQSLGHPWVWLMLLPASLPPETKTGGRLTISWQPLPGEQKVWTETSEERELETQPGRHPTAKGVEIQAADALMTHICLCPPRLLWCEPGAKCPGLPALFPVFWLRRAL